MRLHSLVFLAMFAPAAGGCASPCARVKAAHQEITTRTEPKAPGDHLRLAIPMRLVDMVVARELKSLPRPRLSLPEVAGVNLGSVTVSVDRVKLLPAKPGEIAFSLQATLRSGRRAVLPIVMRAAVKPRLSKEQSSVVIALDRQGVVGLHASIPRGGMRGLTDALWSELPGAARMLTSKKQLAGLAESLADGLMQDATRLIERELLDDLGRVARFEVDLPIEVDAINVRSNEQDVIVGFQTPLPSRTALPASQPRTAPPHQVELSVTASAAVELVNGAMDRGEVPDRFDLDGNAAPSGPLHARLDWSDSGSKPLVVHAFLLDPQSAGRPKKDCAHVTLRATPRVSTKAGHLVLTTGDAKIDEVRGSVAIKAGLFFSGVGRKTFDHVETLATDTQFELGAQDLRAQVENARLQGSNLVLGLSLSGGAAKKRQPRRTATTKKRVVAHHPSDSHSPNRRYRPTPP